VEDAYDNSASKVALVLAVGREAKDHLISEFGLGEELAINIFGWTGASLACVGQMDLQFGDPKDERQRIARIYQTAGMMRAGWGCDAFTLLAEGWVSDKPEETREKDLIQHFTDNKNSPVKECLSILHVEQETEDSTGIHVCAQPFSVSTGKKVNYGTMLHAEGAEMLRESKYIDILSEALTTDVIEVSGDQETLRLTLSMGVADEAGFFIQYDF
jgi:hypothetical protein